jgi:beta-glucosidase
LSSGIAASADGKNLVNLRGQAGGVVARGVDYLRQEDAREIAFGPGASLTLTQKGESTGAYRILYNLSTQLAGKVTLTVGGKVVDVTSQLKLSSGRGWREMIITDDCAPTQSGSISIGTEAPMTMRIAKISRQDMPKGAQCSF